jgi:hypothetical protein
MFSHPIRIGLAGLILALAAPAVVLADYYDNFDDGTYCQDPNDPSLYDPNLWDTDNPHWTMHEMIGDYFLEDASTNWLRLKVQTVWFPFTFLGALADDGNYDANTSATYFDNRSPHYVLTKVKFNDANMGGFMLVLHADPTAWTCYALDAECDGDYFSIDWLDGVSFKTAVPKVKVVNRTGGFWAIIAFDPTGASGTGDPNDPNNHYLRAAMWDGGKFDWNGTWDMQVAIISNRLDPNNWTYWTEGLSGVAAYGSSDTGRGPDADISFDNIEIRHGKFTNQSRTLKLSCLHSNWGTIDLEPNLVDPNDSTIQRYTKGTRIVLAATPNEKKVFKGWTIWSDPNYYGDANYAVLDTNSVLHLTMDIDYAVDADFKCASGVEPLLVIGLMTLTAAVVFRRYA